MPVSADLREDGWPRDDPLVQDGNDDLCKLFPDSTSLLKDDQLKEEKRPGRWDHVSSFGLFIWAIDREEAEE